MRPGRRLATAIGVVVMVLAGALTACSASRATAHTWGVAARLWDVAADAARDAGAGVVEAQAVRTTDATAIRYVTGREPDAADVTRTAVWLVRVTGDKPFSCECSVEPKADGTVDGRYLFFLVSPGTYTWGSWANYRSESLDLTPLGAAIRLHA